jgi:hypothetical protein
MSRRKSARLELCLLKPIRAPRRSLLRALGPDSVGQTVTAAKHAADVEDLDLVFDQPLSDCARMR